jgi:phospholipase/lecithinase/hemolysin
MKILKLVLYVLLASLPLAAGVAAADGEHGYERIFVFGASITDPGNRFAVTRRTAHPPFDPIEYDPYGVGGHRSTNGRTWVEVMADGMNLTEGGKPAYRDPAFGNYAYSYARAREVDLSDGPSLSDQVQAWIDNGYCSTVPMDDTLFVLDTVWADLKDILMGEEPDDVLPGMVDSFVTNIGILYACGARNLMVAYTPPMGVFPGVPADFKAEANYLSEMYNYGLVQGLVEAYSGVMNISTVDFFAFTKVVMAMPEIFGFTNIEDSCVTPGVVKKAFCQYRNGYFFWDALHPTKTAHAVMGRYALKHLPDPVEVVVEPVLP